MIGLAMNITLPVDDIPPELAAEIDSALAQLASGKRDLAAARKAAEEADRIREKNAQLFGVKDVGVEIIREIREGR